MSELKQQLCQQAGEVLTIGFEGQRCDEAAASLLRKIRPGGVIFFQRNIATPEQFQSLVSEVRQTLDGSSPTLALDLEGGLVDRFRDLIAPLPSFHDAARAGVARRLGLVAGRELAAFSLNVDFAPVLDLNTPDSEPVLASRTVSEQPEKVVQCAGEFLAGLAEHQVLGCGKHFPGLGSAPQDSHLRMPAIDKSEEALWREDLLPFRTLAPRLPMIMVAHAWYPALEGSPGGSSAGKEGALPASLSPRIVTGLLRQRIGYQGVVVCDDLEMGGALEGRSIGQAAVAAIRAGCDMLLVCDMIPARRQARNVQAVFAALVQEAEQDVLFRESLARAARRIGTMKQSLAAMAERVATGVQAPPLQELRKEIETLTAEVRSRLASQPLRIK